MGYNGIKNNENLQKDILYWLEENSEVGNSELY